jgi:hypothetical protein
METDPVVAEVRAVREQLAARLGFRLHDIVKEAQRQDAAGDRKVVRLPPRRPIVAGSGAKEPEPGAGSDGGLHPAE